MAFGRNKKAGSQQEMRKVAVSAGHDSVDLRQLRRADLVELLVSDLDTIEGLQSQLTTTTGELTDMTAMAERLKAKLNEKDAQIEHLKDKLNEKDATFERLKKKLDAKDAQLERLKHRLDMKDDQIRSLTGMEPTRDPYVPLVATSMPVAPAAPTGPAVPSQPTAPAAPVVPSQQTTQPAQPVRPTQPARPAWQPDSAAVPDSTSALERLWQETSHLGQREQEGASDGRQGQVSPSQPRPSGPWKDEIAAEPTGGTPSQGRGQRARTQVPRRSQQDPQGTSSFRKVQNTGHITDTSTPGRQRISLGGDTRKGEPPSRVAPDGPPSGSRRGDG